MKTATNIFFIFMYSLIIAVMWDSGFESVWNKAIAIVAAVGLVAHVIVFLRKE